MTAVEERICDRNLLKLLRAMLRAGVLSDGVAHHAVTGTPQGGVISPLLANVYLHRLDREWNSGREWLRATRKSTSSWATGLEVIDVPRSACRVSWSRPMPWRSRHSLMNVSASSPVSASATVQPTT